MENRGRGIGRLLAAVAAATILVGTAGPAVAAPPQNDNFAARTTIPAVPFTEVTSTVEATREPGEPHPDCGPIGKTVWYQYTPPADTVLGANTAGSDFDTLTAVWTGASLGALSPVTCSFGSVVFAADAGTTYLIQAGGFAGEAGTLSFRLREVDAGVISGLVTEAGTGMPLKRICINITDADFPESFSFEVTDTSGRYQVPVRPGSYRVFFSDECDETNDHHPEWYDDAQTFAEADEVVVTGGGAAPNINAALDPACPGHGGFRGDHIIGTEAPDKLVGGPGDDVFCGLGGADRFRGLGGRDHMHGGDGADRLFGGGGRDFLSSENGRDRVGGGAERDRVSGGAGDDELSGGGDRDSIVGGKGIDMLAGGGGDDKLHGSKGDDRMRGGSGKDVCDGDEGEDIAGPSCERSKEVP